MVGLRWHSEEGADGQPQVPGRVHEAHQPRGGEEVVGQLHGGRLGLELALLLSELNRLALVLFGEVRREPEEGGLRLTVPARRPHATVTHLLAPTGRSLRLTPE
ncbi:hypothetical protein [Myxococcus sp. AS-1-15]|uniref:hypothetical protein n=1 Tax=Myxococcus sp. AS-1-15 TaxID=2874600 RepID=UPI001CBF31EF|nr:hypothetical protein [Myxococcus sp. AS-1-15]MBZ4402537.1 hypothetical protein [Myxococcus sp. AS-1-15]